MFCYQVGNFSKVRAKDCDPVEVTRLQEFSGVVSAIGTDVLNQLSTLIALIKLSLGACTELC